MRRMERLLVVVIMGEEAAGLICGKDLWYELDKQETWSCIIVTMGNPYSDS